MPISKIGETNPKILKNKLRTVSDLFDKKEKILWVDFIASGKSFVNFYNNLPEDIQNNSYYFGYGYTLNNVKIYEKRNNLIKKLLKKNKMYYYEISSTRLFQTFLRKILGGSEYYNIRCVKKKIVDNNYQLKLYDNIPIKDTKNSKHCKVIPEAIYNLLKNNNML